MLRKGIKAVITGAPGGGKGTISRKLIDDFSFYHISTGDLLRANVADCTQLGKQAVDYIRKGELVPDDLVLNMLKKELHNHSNDSVLLDGFPRTLSQATQLNNFYQTDVLINLIVPDDTIIARMAQRWIHPRSGRTYAYDYNPPRVKGVDDVTGEPLEQRIDDKPSVVKARLQRYHATVDRLVDFYGTLPQCAVADFVGTESDIIYPKVRSYLLSHFRKSDFDSSS